MNYVAGTDSLSRTTIVGAALGTAAGLLAGVVDGAASSAALSLAGWGAVLGAISGTICGIVREALEPVGRGARSIVWWRVGHGATQAQLEIAERGETQCLPTS